MRNKVPPPVLTIFCIVVLWAIAEFLPAFNFSFLGSSLMGLGLVILGLGLLLWAGVLFKSNKTTVNPFRPNKTKSIVATGPYRFTRNPMYLGMMLTIIGSGLYFGSASLILICLAFWFYMNQTQIKPEEQALTEVFGAEFTDYMSQVRRWI